MKKDENRKIKAKIQELREELSKLNKEEIEPVSPSSFRPDFNYTSHANCTKDMIIRPTYKKTSCETCKSLLASGFSTASCKSHQKS